MAPERNSDVVISILSCRVMPSIGAQSKAEPPPEISANNGSSTFLTKSNVALAAITEF